MYRFCSRQQWGYAFRHPKEGPRRLQTKGRVLSAAILHVLLVTLAVSSEQDGSGLVHQTSSPNGNASYDNELCKFQKGHKVWKWIIEIKATHCRLFLKSERNNFQQVSVVANPIDFIPEMNRCNICNISNFGCATSCKTHLSTRKRKNSRAKTGRGQTSTERTLCQTTSQNKCEDWWKCVGAKLDRLQITAMWKNGNPTMNWPVQSFTSHTCTGVGSKNNASSPAGRKSSTKFTVKIKGNRCSMFLQSRQNNTRQLSIMANQIDFTDNRIQCNIRNILKFNCSSNCSTEDPVQSPVLRLKPARYKLCQMKCQNQCLHCWHCIRHYMGGFQHVTIWQKKQSLQDRKLPEDFTFPPCKDYSAAGNSFSSTLVEIVAAVGALVIILVLLLLVRQKKMQSLVQQSLFIQKHQQQAKSETELAAVGASPAGTDLSLKDVLDSSSRNNLYWCEQDLPSEVDEDTYLLPFEPPPDTLLGLFQQLSKGLCRLIMRERIAIGDKLGKGQFGEVFRGTWTKNEYKSRESVAINVAVKTLKQASMESDRVKFLQEAATMAQFKHCNVMALHGATIEHGELFLILELLTGDLRSYLIDLNLLAPTEEIIRDFPLMVHDIASGMAYLGKRGFVHRDLAARNIMMSEEKTCKIGDFGMSRSLDDDNYYMSQGGVIPLRWSAPEAVYFNKFSTASDVWSFGIVIYEIYELGKKPYASWSMEQTLIEIADGYRLPRPLSCPEELYKIMLSCWNMDKNHRPSFENIIQDVELIFPKLHGKNEPGVEKEDKPSIKKDDKQNIKKDDKQTVEKDDKPIVEKDDEPIVEKGDKQSVEKEDKQSVEKEDKPIVEKEDKPSIEKEDDPSVKKEDKPSTDGI